MEALMIWVLKFDAAWFMFVNRNLTDNLIYRQTSNISRILVGNNIVGHSGVVGASPVGTDPTTSALLTKHMASIDWAKTTAIQYEKYWSFVIWRFLY